MNVAVIGAGVSGLAAGCYLQMSRFQTRIFERTGRAGGLCTGWKRGDYTFESGFQWLLGSGPANPFYQLWSELLDMHSLEFITHESRMDIEVKESESPSGEKIFHLYTNLVRWQDYLTGISPEDGPEIRRLIATMRKMQSFEIPPQIKNVPALLPPGRKISYIRHLPLLFFMNRIKKETNYSFARKLKSAFLREAFELLFDGEELPLMIITIPLAFSDLHAAGYPLGGSDAVVSRLMEKYVTLGGRVHFHSPVGNIIVENSRATGVRLETGEEIAANMVLSAADWHFTLFEALGGNHVTNRIRKLGNRQGLEVYYSVIIVSLGIARSFAGEPHFLRFPVEPDVVSPDGTAYSRMEAHIYNYDPTLAPEGKTVVSLCFYTRKADYWIGLRESDRERYLGQKTAFAEEAIERVEKRFGRIREFVEEVDVATPATLYRYTGNWKGSAQGWLPGKNLIAPSPVKPTLPGLQNFYYAGHWSIPGGGLPVALKSARDAVQILCHDAGKPFCFDE